MKISVMGSGGWGTALALVLLENGHDVTLWSYTEAESAVLREQKENPMLKGVALPDGLKPHLRHRLRQRLRRGGAGNSVLCRAYYRPDSGPSAGPRRGAGLCVQGH